jgi:hypothetical protein
MTTERTSERDASVAEEILTRRDASCTVKYDQAVKHDATGEWYGRRADDHTRVEKSGNELDDEEGRRR